MPVNRLYCMRTRRAALVALASMVIVVSLFPGLAEAQNSLGLGRPEQAIKPTGFFGPWLYQIQQYQQEFYRSLTASLKAMRENGSNVWTMVGLSFAYGIFHAAGPGHGKAVISAWLLATENELRRGILISAMSAVIQALTAIALVSVLLLAVASVGATARNVAGTLESASYALIGFMGLYLMWTAIRRPAQAHAGHPRRDAIQHRGELSLPTLGVYAMNRGDRGIFRCLHKLRTMPRSPP